MRRHIKELADKQYQRMVKNSAEHVLMFIPNEGAYITAVGLDPDLWDYAYQRKVCIVAPAHLFSVMQLINRMWNSEQRNNNADNIAKLGGLLYDKFVGFANETQRIEKSLDDARNAYDACYRSLTRGGTSLVSRAERLRPRSQERENTGRKDTRRIGMFDTRIVESTIGHWHKQDIYGTYNPKHLKRRNIFAEKFCHIGKWQ